jgi:hypothetical protein
VPEIPGERAEDRRVDAVELVVVERLDQQQGAFARLREAVGDLLVQQCLRGAPDPARLDV